LADLIAIGVRNVTNLLKQVAHVGAATVIGNFIPGHFGQPGNLSIDQGLQFSHSRWWCEEAAPPEQQAGGKQQQGESLHGST
jgi:hypothetical protein